MARGSAIAGGLAIVALALALPLGRRPDGGLLPLAWTAAIAGVALIVGAAGLGGRWQSSAAWLSLALIGQASALALVHAPNYNVLQHYRPWGELMRTGQLAFLVVPIAQTLLAVGAAATRWRRAADRVPAVLSPLQAVGLGAAVLFTAANASSDLRRFAAEMALAVWIIGVNALTLIHVAESIPDDALAAAAARARALGAGGGARPWSFVSRYYPWLAALAVSSVSAVLAWAVFERMPHSPDSTGYVFQAKYFATGLLYAPAPADAAAFDFEKLLVDGEKWWNYGFPGWPAVLALGVLARAEWLVNPVLGGLTVVLAHGLAARLYDLATARAVVALLAVSPWFLFMSASFMPHPISVVWTLLALVAVEKARESDRARWGALAGTALGALFLTRPLEAVLLGPVVGLWAMAPGSRRTGWRSLAALTVSGSIVGGLLFAYSRALTGNGLTSPHQRWADARWYPGADRLGFGADIGNLGWPHLDPFPGHGLVDVLVNAHQNLYMANFELFGWSFGSLAFAVVFVLGSGWSRADRLFVVMAAAIVAGHSFYWFSGGPGFGARYWYQTLVPLVVLTARGIQQLRRRWSAAGRDAVGGARIAALATAASLVAVVNVVPWRSLEKYHDYRHVSGDVARLVETGALGRSLVFVQEGPGLRYASAFFLNSPTLDGPGPVFARDLGAERRRTLQSSYPDRAVWFLAGPTRPGADLRLMGPLPPLAARRGETPPAERGR